MYVAQVKPAIAASLVDFGSSPAAVFSKRLTAINVMQCLPNSSGRAAASKIAQGHAIACSTCLGSDAVGRLIHSRAGKVACHVVSEPSSTCNRTSALAANFTAFGSDACTTSGSMFANQSQRCCAQSTQIRSKLQRSWPQAVHPQWPRRDRMELE